MIRSAEESKFQSSPVTKDGRYLWSRGHQWVSALFQSSPVTKDGRYLSDIRASAARARFNPRPSLRTGATRVIHRNADTDLFQSSPVTKDGRYS